MLSSRQAKLVDLELSIYKTVTIIRKKTDNNGFAGFLDEMARTVGLGQDIVEELVK